MSLVLLGEIIGMFLNTLSANGKYPIEGWENLPLQIQMQLSKTRKKCFEFFVPFIESGSNFTDFNKKIIVIANVFTKLQTVKILFRPLSKKRHFRKRFERQHARVSQVSQILAKCP